MKTIVCFGDSNTYGYSPVNGLRYEKDVRWPGRLQQLLGKDYSIVEEGCNGRTTVFIDKEEPWKCGRNYVEACMNSHKPIDLLIVMLGSNDMKKIYQASAKEIAQGMEEIISLVQSFLKVKQGKTPKILLISPPLIGENISKGPFQHSFDESAVEVSRQLSGHYEKLAEKYHCLFLDAAKVVLPSVIDQLHLMPEEHEKLAQALYQIVKEQL